MNFKIIGYIGAGLLILVLIGGIGWKLIAKTEGYRAQEQNFYSFEPHYIGIGGCARYEATRKPDSTVVKAAKIEVKKNAK